MESIEIDVDYLETIIDRVKTGFQLWFCDVTRTFDRLDTTLAAGRLLFRDATGASSYNGVSNLRGT